MDRNTFTASLLEFITRAVTPFHAVDLLCGDLENHDFLPLQESQSWDRLQPGRYFVRRNDSSLIAFTLTNEPFENGLRLAGAHTDSPCLKVKPTPGRINNSYLQCGIEVYGGALLSPWFDRDLSLAGRVAWLDRNGAVGSSLIDFQKPIAVIPSLAIHLDREANKKKSINKETDLVPIVMQTAEGREPDFNNIVREQLLREHPGIKKENPAVLDHELFFYDTQPPALVGLHNEFITGARLDNLLSCFVLTRALLDSAHPRHALIVLYDHEEAGSLSSSGAQGPFLQSVLARLVRDHDVRQRCISNSLFISVDNSHAVHPNFPGKHDTGHQPLLNHGPVIKYNANQRYATNSITASFFRRLCRQAEIPVQEFVMRSDMACGSTIGPIIAGGIGAPTVDVGIPSLAMHSIRETAGSHDGHDLYSVIRTFFQRSGQHDSLRA